MTERDAAGGVPRVDAVLAAGAVPAAGGTPVVVAVDLGSSGVRCTAYTDDYRVLGSFARDLATTVGADGRSTHSWPQIVESTESALAQLCAEPGIDVRAISLSGTASSLAVSRRYAQGRPREVGDLLLWSDTRAAAFSDEAVDPAATAARFQRTLCPSHISYWPAKLRWMVANESVPADGELQFAGGKDYLFELLTGEFWVDPMTAAATGVFDSVAWRWDEPFLSSVGVQVGQLPVIRAATDRAPILPELARRLGIAADTPIVLGGMDGPLSQLGAAGFATDAHTCTVGTSMAYRAGVGTRTVDASERVWCYPIFEDFWVVGGAGSNGGNVFTWLAETFGRENDVGEIVAEALARQPDAGLLFLPYLNGERAPLWTDDVRAAIIGLAAHHGAADIARAALDGVGAAAIELADAVTSLVGAADEVRLTGGFLRQGEWAQLVTDSLGVDTCVPDPEAATSTGVAVLAWMSLGRARPQPPLPAVATAHRAPDLAVHEVLRRKAEALRITREALLALPV